MKKVVTLAIALFVAVSASASDRDDAVRVAVDFYRAYAGSDLDRALALWSPQSPSLDRLRRKGRLLRTHCFELGAIATNVTAIDDASATLDVRAEWLDASVMAESRPIVDFADGTIVLRRDARRWEIVDWRPAAVEMADALVKADAAERARLLANPRIRCRSAVREIARRAVTLVNQGDYDRAGALAAAAAEIADRTGDDASTALAAAAASIVDRYRTRLDSARALAERAVHLAEHGGDADALLRAYLAYGTWDSAAFAKAFALRHVVSDAALIALAASRMAMVSDMAGDHWSSLQYVKIAEPYAQESGDPAAIIDLEQNLAGTYGLYADTSLAMRHLRKVVALAQRAKFGAVAADALLIEADLEEGSGHSTRAARLTDEASRIPIADGAVALHLALRRFYENRYSSDADQRLAEIRRLAETRGDADPACQAIRIMARAEFDRGHRKASIRLVEQLRDFESWESTQVRWANEFEIAWIERRAGNTDEALRAVRNAIAISEQERARILGSDRQPQTFFRSRLRAYRELAAILASQRKPLDALAVSDEAKGRTLLDILRSNHLSVERAMSAEERAHERQLRERAAALRREGADATTLAQSRTDVDNFENAMTVKYPGAAPTWSAPATLTASMLRQVLTEPDMAIVEYMITDDRLYIFVATRGGDGTPRVRVRSTAVGDAALRKRITRLATCLALADDEFRSQARRLYGLLLSPIASDLARARVVCIIPDGPLWQLPFESLIAPDGTFFVQHAAAFYSPSVAVYAQMRNAPRADRRAEGTLFALADPAVGATRDAGVSRLRAGEATPLPDAAREVETAARILGGKSAVYIGASASRERFETEAASYRIVHFATHGVLDDVDPMYSHLVLASSGRGDDGVLEAWQMMRTKLHAELTVLSACNTARGGVREGEGVVGMSWALFVAGCPSTIAAQWKIASASTADLMIAFYRHWNEHGNGPFAKTKALAAAQREMLRRRGKRHPFFWAPFILVGVG